uniref:Uncharacterized protein n=1 Tax=Laticauda laticaudata TaxID=8630 RepID=A0A8C5S878_LATLA
MFLIWLGLVPVMEFCVSTAHAGNLILHMDTVIEILNDVEFHFKTPDLIMAQLYQELEFCNSKVCQFVLGPVTSRTLDLPYLSKAKRMFFKNLMNHTFHGSEVEHGVVLTPDGTTISISHLFAGIAAGLKMKNELTLPEKPLITGPPNNSGEESQLSLDPLISSTISMDLGMTFLLFYSKQNQVALGPNGCWDSISEPRTFILMGPPSYMPDAVINGAMDGFILGTHLVEKVDPPSNISVLLNDYYGSKGLNGKEKIRSNFRRKIFAALLSKEKLQEQVENALGLLWKMNEASSLFEGITDKKLTFLTKQAIDEFMTMYVGMSLVRKIDILIGSFHLLLMF